MERVPCAGQWFATLRGFLTALGMPSRRHARASNISHTATRLLRHGPDPNRREPQLEIDLKGGTALLEDMARYKSSQAYGCTWDGMRVAANDVFVKRKKRPGIIPDERRSGYRVKALNGRALEIRRAAANRPIPQPGIALHRASQEAAHLILHNGLFVMKRQEIHLVDY